MGLLPAGTRTWDLPTRAPGRHRRSPSHAVAMAWPGTPPGRNDGDVTDPAEDDRRLHRLLGGESTGWLVRRARDRMETGRPLIGTVTLAGATVEQRRAIERLTGRPARSG